MLVSTQSSQMQQEMGAHKEVKVVVLRYLHNKCLYERTVGLVDISKDQTAQGIAIAIQEILSPIELNPSQCVNFFFRWSISNVGS